MGNKNLPCTYGDTWDVKQLGDDDDDDDEADDDYNYDDDYG